MLEQTPAVLDATIPHLVPRAASQVLMVDGAPFTMLAGEVHNSTSSSRTALAAALDQAQALGMNSVLAPVSWELVEPEEGRFDFDTVDFALNLARERGLHLGLLWFGAFKNAQCYYAPPWVKRDLARFRRAEMVKGARRLSLECFYGMSYSALSLFCSATRDADARAFAELMAHIREVDAERRTVVCVQVENECGLMGAAREHSDAADAAFAEQVPADLVAALRAADPAALAPDVAGALAQGAAAGTWEEVFGPVAEELFTAYHMAGYVEAVARAGKAAYPLPFTVNCWLDKGHEPGRFPSGGPVARVMEVWRHAAPSIDIVGPDIYVPDFCDVCDAYRKLGNPLFIPESATHAYAAARQIWAIGHHRAVCYAPFGFEDLGQPFDASAGILFGADASDKALATPQDAAEYGQVTRLLGQLLSLAPDAVGTPRLDAVTSERPEERLLAWDGLGVRVSFGRGALPGACAAVQVGPGELYLLAFRCALRPVSIDPERPHVDILVAEDGCARDGAWVPDRRLNGDEATMMRYDGPALLHLQLFNYA